MDAVAVQFHLFVWCCCFPRPCKASVTNNMAGSRGSMCILTFPLSIVAIAGRASPGAQFQAPPPAFQGPPYIARGTPPPPAQMMPQSQHHGPPATIYHHPSQSWSVLYSHLSSQICIFLAHLHCSFATTIPAIQLACEFSNAGILFDFCCNSL